MNYRTLGHSGLSVSSLILGTMGFGTETNEKEAFAILDAYLDAGGNTLDTSDVYGKGASEELIGRWRKSRTGDIADRTIIATKARFGNGPDANDVGLSRRHLQRSLDKSLARLGTQSIDLYQLHGWDPLTPVEETLSFLDAALRAGKIHYVGVSNFTGWQLQLFISTAKAMGVPVPVTMQQQYSLAYRELEYEIIPAAIHNDVGLLPWSPLAAGFLTGKYVRHSESGAGGRLTSDNPMNQHIARHLHVSEQKWATLEVVKDIARQLGATPSQVALSWLGYQPSVTAPVIGARTIEQLQDNLGAVDVVLDAAALQRLGDASAPTPDDYPYGRFGMLQRERYVDSSEQALREL